MSWSKASRRFLSGALYSQAKQPRIQTSAKPRRDLDRTKLRSKQYRVGSSGSGTWSSLHRSMKWACAPARSFNAEAELLGPHLRTNSLASMTAPVWYRDMLFPTLNGGKCSLVSHRPVRSANKAEDHKASRCLEGAEWRLQTPLGAPNAPPLVPRHRRARPSRCSGSERRPR